MRSDFEQRLRRALEARADDVTPDPNIWRKVEARIHRDRAVRLALLRIAAVLVFALVAVSPLIRTRIELVQGDGRPVDQPVPGPAPETPAAAPAPQIARPAVPATRYCAGAGGVAAVLATASGDLAVSCAAGGTEPLTEGAELDAHPVIAGGIVVFERRATPTSGAHLVALDLETGEASPMGSGAWPAFGPEGEFAFIVDAPGDGQQPEIVVRQALDGPILARFKIFEDGAEELSARHLTFGGGGNQVFWEAGHEGSGHEGSAIWASALDNPEPIRLDSAGQGATLAAPTSREPGMLTAISRCCAEAEGDRPTTAKLVTRDQRGSSTELMDLAKLDGFDTASTELFLAPAGQAILDSGRWRPTDQPAWLVGDGRRLFLVSGGGTATLVSDNAASGAFDARLAPSGASSSGQRLVSVQIYLAPHEATDCQATVAVPRQVAAPAVLRGALTQLLAGPTPEEQAQGYGGMFSPATEGYLRDVWLDPDGVAHVDFRDLRPVIPSASSSCASSVLLGQLDSTVMQFRNIKAARYSIEGDEAAFYEWLQRSPPAPARLLGGAPRAPQGSYAGVTLTPPYDAD